MAEPLAQVGLERVGSFGVVRVSGEVDLSNVAAVRDQIRDALGDGAGRPVLDLTRAAYFDSAGVRMLFALAAELRERGDELSVVAPGEGVVRRILDLTEVASVCPIYLSLDEIPDD